MQKPSWYPPWGSEGPYFEDFEVGMVVKSWPGRTLTVEDNLAWIAHTGDANPLYFDLNYARLTEHGEIIIHPLLVMQLMVALAVRDTSINTMAFLGAEYHRLYLPVRPGDTVYVESEVVSKRESKSRPEAGIVSWIHRGYNQRNELIGEVKRTNLIYKKEFAPWRDYLKKVRGV